MLIKSKNDPRIKVLIEPGYHPRLGGTVVNLKQNNWMIVLAPDMLAQVADALIDLEESDATRQVPRPTSDS